MKRQRQGCLLAGVLFGCLIFYALTMLPQDLKFLEYKNSFGEIKHPPGTKFILSYDAFGALDKTRVMYKDDFPQGCDYRVGEVREYTGSQVRIKSFYATQTAPFSGQKIPIGVMLLPTNSDGLINLYGLTRAELIEVGPGGYSLLESLQADQAFMDLSPSASYYFVSIGGFSLSDLDLRCQF